MHHCYTSYDNILYVKYIYYILLYIITCCGSQSWSASDSFGIVVFKVFIVRVSFDPPRPGLSASQLTTSTISSSSSSTTTTTTPITTNKIGVRNGARNRWPELVFELVSELVSEIGVWFVSENQNLITSEMCPI